MACREVTDIPTLRFQLALLVAILLQGLQSVALSIPASAAEEAIPRHHSLIHRPAVESAALPSTPQGTILQSSGAQPIRIETPIGPPKTAASLPSMPLTHHRTLTRRPAIASTTAPPTSPQALRAAPISNVAAGQVAPGTGNSSKGVTPTPMALVTKSMTAPLSGGTSTGSAAISPTSFFPFSAAAGVRSTASVGGGSSRSLSGSRSALNVLQNSEIAGLLQAPTPMVTTPPSLPPPSPPPQTAPPPSPSTENVTLTWTANRESDLAGYKIYLGTASGLYNFPGSAFVAGKVTSYTIFNLPKGQTYFFAMSAYDNAGNESQLSAEISKSLF